MSLSISLQPEEEREFRQIAEAANLDAESYARQLIQQVVRGRIALDVDGSTPPENEIEGRIRLLREGIAALKTKDLPFYPDEVMTRAWIYGDHP